MLSELVTKTSRPKPGCENHECHGFELHCSKAACAQGILMSSKCHICSYKGLCCLALCCNELQLKSETAVVQCTDRLALVYMYCRHTMLN